MQKQPRSAPIGGSRISQTSDGVSAQKVRVPTYYFGHFPQELNEIEKKLNREGDSHVSSTFHWIRL